jgi:solute carrier family 25 carnitine/acylcarnitine transporter 20/29
MDMVLFSGLFTGIPSALIVTPTDHMRIKMQISNTKYNSSVQVGRKIFEQYGIKGLYQGFYPTILGEVMGMGIYFATYEGVIRQLR